MNNKLFSHKLKILNYDGLWENKKILGYKWTLQLDKIDSLISIGLYRWLADINLFVWLDDLACLTIIRKNESGDDLLNKGSNFAYFVRFRPYAYTGTQQSLLPLCVAITDKHWKTWGYYMQHVELRRCYIITKKHSMHPSIVRIKNTIKNPKKKLFKIYR